MIAPLTDQIVSGQYAAFELRAATNMLERIAQWDLLRYSEKLHESAKGTASRFHEVPGFTPRWCGFCLEETLPDFRNDPDGECLQCGTPADYATDRAAA